MEDLVKNLETMVEKLKQDPVKLSEEKEMLLKTVTTKYEVLEKNHKLAMEYITALEEQNMLLKQCACACDVSKGCMTQSACGSSPSCELPMGGCPVGFAASGKGNLSSEASLESFWYYVSVFAFLYWIILLFLEPSH